MIRNSVNNATSSFHKEVNTDMMITQTLEGYVLPLLPTVPLYVHNIHLKCKIIAGSTEYYQALALPRYKKNIGKYQILDIDNVPVRSVFYPSGTIDMYTKNSERPFKLGTDKDRINLIAFIGKIKDNLPPQVAVPDIHQWEFTECDINRDVKVSDILHISSVKVQVKHMDHLFRIYIKRINNETFCRVEETKNLKMPVIDAINHIVNPYDSVERQLSEIQRLLKSQDTVADMNIKIRNNNSDLLKKICKETKMTPSQLIEYFLGVMHFLYSDYERQNNEGIEKRSFSEILTNLFLHSFKSKLRTLDIAKKLIENTNELLGIKDHIGACVHNINTDFDNRSISYIVGYDYCVDAANIYAYKSLLIEVEINQDYIEVSHVVYVPTLESMEITDKKVNNTSNLIQEYIRAKHRKKFSPFANIVVELLPVGENPVGPSLETHQYIGIKLIVKADKAAHIPSIEKIGLIAKEVHAIVHKKLLAK
jgi:hypothetical protein